MVVAILVIGGLQSTVAADDWPQINGPTRNGVASGEKLLTDWPADGPKKVWSHPVGGGNAGAAVVDGQVIIFHRPGDLYLVEALDAKTGKLIWNTSLSTKDSRSGHDGDNGPKAVPLVHKDHIYLLGVGGNLYCLKRRGGAKVWQRNLMEEYPSPRGYFGAGSTPIVVDDKLLINVGGRGTAIVAFDLLTGDELWKSFDDNASYSSPIEMEFDGRPIAVFVTRLHLVGVDPKDGTVLFQTRFGSPGPTVNGAMPLAVGDHIFVNAAYGVGAKWCNLAGGKLEVEWENKNTFASHYCTPVLVAGHLFGTTGREDYRNGEFRCFDPSTGAVKWSEQGVPVGHTLFVDGKLLVTDCNGGFHVLQPDTRSFKRVHQSQLFEGKARAMPAVANGLLYLRSNPVNGAGELAAFQIGQSE